VEGDGGSDATPGARKGKAPAADSYPGQGMRAGIARVSKETQA